VTILAALCSRTSTVYALTHADNAPQLRQISVGSLGSTGANSQKFLLDYEPNTTIGELTIRPKVQKYHTREELEQLFGEFFEQVSIDKYQSTEYGVTARKAKPVDPVKLREALDFEFNVPYSNGERMDRHTQAIEAFSKRLKISL
jgi:hypothetical protein